MAFDNARTLNCYELRTLTLLSMSGRLRKQVVYSNSFYGWRLVGFSSFWFLFPIHKVGVLLLLL